MCAHVSLNVPCVLCVRGGSSSLTRVGLRFCQSGGGSPQSQRPAELSDDEVGELFQRLAEVQQEKWMLEEKVSLSFCYRDNQVLPMLPSSVRLPLSPELKEGQRLKYSNKILDYYDFQMCSEGSCMKT